MRGRFVVKMCRLSKKVRFASKKYNKRASEKSEALLHVLFYEKEIRTKIRLIIPLKSISFTTILSLLARRL